MNELLVAAGAGLLWLLPFLLLVAWIRAGGRTPAGTAVLIAYPIFFALQVLLAKGAALSGLLDVTGFRVLYVLLAIGGGALWLVRRSRGMRVGTEGPKEGRKEGRKEGQQEDDPDVALVRRIVLGLVALALVVLAVFTLVSPVHVWDVLAYHMPMVASYVQNGSLEPWPTQELRQVYRVNAGELQLLNVALLARSDVWVELPNLLGLAVFLVGARELARLAPTRRALPLLAVGLVLTAPQIVVAATTAKNDLTFSAVLLAAFYWAIRAGGGGAAEGPRVGARVGPGTGPDGASPEREGAAQDGASRPRRADPSTGPSTGTALALAALCGALAAATKVLGLNVLGATGLLVLLLAWRGRLRWRTVPLFAGLAAAFLLLLAGDVYWRNLMRDTIPVGIAPGELHVTFGLANLVEPLRYYLYDLSFRRLLVPPPFEHDFLHYGYLFPFMLVLGLVGALRQWRRRDPVLSGLAVAGAALFVSVIALRLPIQWDQRFMIWMVPVTSILALSLAERVPFRHVLVLCGLVAGLGLVNLTTGLLLESDRLFLRSARHLVRTGSPARYTDVPNERYRFRSDGFELLDRAAERSDSVLYVGTEDSWMYLAWGPRFARHVEGVRDAEQAAARVESRGFRFVVLERAAREELGVAVTGAAERSGYDVLSSDAHRLFLVRAP